MVVLDKRENQENSIIGKCTYLTQWSLFLWPFCIDMIHFWLIGSNNNTVVFVHDAASSFL